MRFFGFLYFFILLPLALSAQYTLFISDSTEVKDDIDSQKVTESIVDRINSSEPGKGTVRIIQDDSVSERIGRPGKNNSHSNSGVANYIEISGWRIQVFSGNNQRIAKNEAFRKEADIKSVFPELGTYVSYTAPFWRLRVGDFQTFQDARDVLLRIKGSFPSFGREMSIVKEKIQIKQE